MSKQDPSTVREQLAEALRPILHPMATGRTDVQPVGCWLHDDLLRLAYEACNEIGRRAADRLGLPESTFRRKLHQLRDEEGIEYPRRPRGWKGIRKLLDTWTEAYGGETDVLDEARLVMVELSQELFPTVGRQSLVVGVTQPTFRVWRTKLADRKAA